MPIADASAEQITITLPKETAKVIRDAVASGEYADESDFVAARVHDYQACDLSEEEFRREVLPVIEAMKADPSRGRTIEQVRESLAEAYAVRKAS